MAWWKNVSRNAYQNQLNTTSDWKKWPRKIINLLHRCTEYPIILRWSVYFNLAIYFLFRGQKVHHQLKLDLFTFHTDENGEYAMIRHENQPKTHQTALENVEMNVDKRMYATGTDTCPVKMFKLLIEKNDESATCLFNKYTSDAVSLPNSTSKWFINAPLQKRTFSNFMKDICRAAGLSHIYIQGIV